MRPAALTGTLTLYVTSCDINLVDRLVEPSPQASANPEERSNHSTPLDFAVNYMKWDHVRLRRREKLSLQGFLARTINFLQQPVAASTLKILSIEVNYYFLGLVRLWFQTASLQFSRKHVDLF